MKGRFLPLALLVATLAAGGCRSGETSLGDRFELYTHCGVELSLIRFDGSYWSNPTFEVDADLGDPFDYGYMRLIGPGTALYVSDGGARIRFERLGQRPDLPICA